MRRVIALLAGLICVGQLQAQTGLLDLKPGGAMDLNHLKLDPKWRCQDDQNCNGSAQIPDAKICDHKPGDPVSTVCRTQSTSDDGPTAVFKKLVCSLAPSLLHGHVNFEEPVTLTGDLAWDGHSDDFDYDLILTTRDGRLITTRNSTQGTIALELDSRETVDRFSTITPWWAEFKARVSNPARLQTVADLFDAHADNAVAIGLLGVDCEHSCHSELHPIYALAFRAFDSKPAKEHWIVLARNFGDEGFCSHRQHPLGTTSQFPALHILIPKPSMDVDAKGSFVPSSGSVAVVLTPVIGVGIDVSVPLTDPKSRQVVLGEVWVTGTAPAMKSMSRFASVESLQQPSKEEENGSESVLRSLIANMPKAQQRQLHTMARVPGARQGAAKASVATMPRISIDQYSLNKLQRSSNLRVTPEADIDLIHEKNDLDLWKSICAAYNNQLPDSRLNAACAPDALTISNEK